MPTLLSEAEGNTGHGANRKSCSDPARSQTLGMSGGLLHRSWEISSATVATSTVRAGKVSRRNPVIHADEKSDTSKVPERLSNKGPGPLNHHRLKARQKGGVHVRPT